MTPFEDTQFLAVNLIDIAGFLVLLICLMAGWDWWKGRLMRSFVVGAAGSLAMLWMATMLYFWGALEGAHAWVGGELGEALRLENRKLIPCGGLSHLK